MGTAQFGFNGNPTSVSVKTGSYTIPAGNYAYITASLDGSSTFSIDGNVALTGSTWSAISKASGNLFQVTVASASTRLDVDASNAGTSPTGIFQNSTASPPVVGNFWVPTGTALTTSGGRYTVQLF